MNLTPTKVCDILQRNFFQDGVGVSSASQWRNDKTSTSPSMFERPVTEKDV
jgi:hypothetical protein